MKDKQDTIYAFPLGIDQSNYCYAPGMTLRDYFAAAALMGYMAWSPTNVMSQGTPESTARNAYRYADAMLKEREK